MKTFKILFPILAFSFGYYLSSLNSITNEMHEKSKIKFNHSTINELAFTNAQIDIQSQNVDNFYLEMADLIPYTSGLEYSCVMSENYRLYTEAYIKGLQKYYPNSELHEKMKNRINKNASHP